MHLNLPKFDIGALVKVVTEEQLWACLAAPTDEDDHFNKRTFVHPKFGEILLYLGPGEGIYTVADDSDKESITTVHYHRFLYQEQIIDIIEFFLADNLALEQII